MTPPVLLDASFWIALRDAREPWHSRARQATEKLFRELTQDGVHQLSTGGGKHTRYFKLLACPGSQQILDDAEKNPTLRWEPVLLSDETDAVALLRQQRDKEYSVVRMPSRSAF